MLFLICWTPFVNLWMVPSLQKKKIRVCFTEICCFILHFYNFFLLVYVFRGFKSSELMTKLMSRDLSKKCALLIFFFLFLKCDSVGPKNPCVPNCMYVLSPLSMLWILTVHKKILRQFCYFFSSSFLMHFPTTPQKCV